MSSSLWEWVYNSEPDSALNLTDSREPIYYNYQTLLLFYPYPTAFQQFSLVNFKAFNELKSKLKSI